LHAYLGGGKSSHCVRNKSEDFGVCVWIQKDGQKMFVSTTTGDCCFLFSLRLKIFLFFGKEILVFATCSTTSQPQNLFLNQKVSPNPKKQREKSTHLVEFRVTLPWKVV
jgi:hypothetical protein